VTNVSEALMRESPGRVLSGALVIATQSASSAQNVFAPVRTYDSGGAFAQAVAGPTAGTFEVAMPVTWVTVHPET
jgi:hypothetical protein